MYIRRNIRWRVILLFAWSYLLMFFAWNIAVVFLFLQFEQIGLNVGIPFAPLGTIGIAVALYIGFKNNQSYDRNWEARKIWGGIVNCSRSWANQVLAYVSTRHATTPISDDELRSEQQILIYRHLAWITALRYQLRRKQTFGLKPRGTAKSFVREDDIEELKKLLCEFLPRAELMRSCSQLNAAAQIIRNQGEHLRVLMEEKGLIEDFRHIAMMDMLTECYTLQGKCERIKNTPFPRQYAYFSKLFTWIFILLLPFGLVGEFMNYENDLVWLTVPFSVLISWIFVTMEMVGDSSEDPFENFINDVPITAICRNIEIDLKQMLGETELPEPIQPKDDILM